MSVSLVPGSDQHVLSVCPPAPALRQMVLLRSGFWLFLDFALQVAQSEEQVLDHFLLSFHHCLYLIPGDED